VKVLSGVIIAFGLGWFILRVSAALRGAAL
jgi:hypothetical protein